MEAVIEPEQAVEERKSSTHKAEVVPVRLDPHPDADTLSVVKVWDYQCCVRSSDWAGIDKAVYLVPDSVVDVRRPEFTFLADQAKADGSARIKAKKLRGVVSYGLLIPAPADAKLGDDLADFYGVTRYEPPEPGEGQKDRFVIGGEEEQGPDLNTGPNKYDVEAFERYASLLLKEGEPVFVMEKADGSNCRVVYHGGRFWVKTRKRWVKREPDYSHVTFDGLTAKGVPPEKAQEVVDNLHRRPKGINGFWEVLERTPALMEYLKKNEGTVVFGEVFGSTNRIKYGMAGGNHFAAFDVYRGGRFLDVQEMTGELALAGAPLLPYFNSALEKLPPEVEGIPYSLDAVKRLAEGDTTIPGAKPGTMREGVVVRPMAERYDHRLGRVILKCVSPAFLAK